MFSGEIPAEFWTRETGEGDLLDARIATMGVVSQVIRQAQDADVVQAGPSLELARMGWALAHGVATLALEDQPYFQGAGGAIERVAEETATVFLRGVGTR